MFSKNNYIVHIGNLKNNVDIIRKKIGNKVKICAIVKANAYGVGLDAVVNAIKGRVDFFGVANADEAMNLRTIDAVTSTHVLGEVNLDAIKWCADNNVSVTISTLDSLHYIIANYSGTKLRVHLAVNTGLNRIGFCNIKTFCKAVELIKKSNVMILEGCFTHFATKQNDLNFIEIQCKNFKKYINYLPKGVIVHCANSYVALNLNSHHFDMVRPGFALYGEHKCNYKLKPAISITSQIVHIMRVKRGQTIGYDRSFVADKAMKVGVVPVGYADGLHRALSNNFYLLVGGRRAPIVGKICMDVTMIDLTLIPYVYVGSKVTILGKDDDEKLSLIDYANVLNTSPYEVLLKFNYRRMNYVIDNE